MTLEGSTDMTDSLADLSSRGVSIWLDDLSRPRLVTGSLAGLAAFDASWRELGDQLRTALRRREEREESAE
jgi:hypothetical protein